LKDCTGTVVLWERLDRILGYRQPYGEMARKRLSQMCRDVEQHLGMVFHRFLNGEVRKKRFKLLLNGNSVAPWDPFCRNEAKTRALQVVTLKVEHEGITGEVKLQPFILPPQDDFSSPEAFRLASGPANWNQQQGFYIYRAGRMIQSGGWSNLRAPDEHMKLARIAVDFSPALDEAFKINVAKMRVQLPAQLREEVREATAPVLKLAREIYDKKRLQTSKTSSGLQPKSTSLTPPKTGSIDSGQTKGEVVKPFQGETPGTGSRLTQAEWASRMLNAADDAERPIVSAVLNRLGIRKNGD